jgi:hypothetical protein
MKNWIIKSFGLRENTTIEYVDHPKKIEHEEKKQEDESNKK